MRAVLFLGTLGVGAKITRRLSSSHQNWGLWNFCQFACVDLLSPFFGPGILKCRL